MRGTVVNIVSSLPTLAAGGSARRRLATGAAALGISAVALLGASGTAHAGVAGSADCDHWSTSTSISDPLPANSNFAGWTTQEWLYRSNGTSWVWTGAYTYARGTSYGTWLNPNGNMIQQLYFSVGRGSGAYILLRQVTSPTGAASSAWVKNYDYDFSGRLAYYCAA